MKVFNTARVQFSAMDEETEERYQFTISDLEENADEAEITTIAQALDPILDVDIDRALITESHHVVF